MIGMAAGKRVLSGNNLCIESLLGALKSTSSHKVLSSKRPPSILDLAYKDIARFPPHPDWRNNPSLKSLVRTVTFSDASSLHLVLDLDPNFHRSVRCHASFLDVLTKHGVACHVPVIFLFMTLACVTDGDFRVVIALYRKLKPRLTPVCYNQLLQSLATSSNLLCEMKRVYADVSSPSVGTSNIMISAYCRHGYVVESNQYLCKMIHSGFTPDLSTFKSLIMGYSRINEVDAALGVFHTNMVQHPDLKCYQQLTMGLCAADKLGIAQRLLDQIQGLDQMDEMQGPRRRMVFEQLLTQHEYEEAANIVEDMICSRHVVDLKDCKTLICGLFEHGKKERAIQVFYKLLQCDCYYDDEIAWTILIRGVLRKHGLAGAFSQLFQAMRKSGSHLSPQTRLALIRGLRRKTVPTLVQ